MTSEAQSGGNALTRNWKGHGMGPLPRAKEIMWPCHIVVMDGLVTAHRFQVARTVGEKIHFCCFKSPSLWPFVLATVENQCWVFGNSWLWYSRIT